MTFLEDCWKQREENIYPSLFGSILDEIYPLNANIFSSAFKRESVDPRWLTYGVMKSPPSAARNTWLYISSGMSNPWETDAPEEYSGIGTEFILEAKENVAWAINFLQYLIAYNILITHGHFNDRTMIDYGQRIPVTITKNDGRASSLTHLLIVKPIHYPSTFELASGKVHFLHVIGITANEYAIAKSESSDVLFNKLIKNNVYPITDIDRCNEK